MEKLPKIALKQLRQGTTGASPEAGAAEHPDADLLTAFAEKKITERERASVMAHLADCETCREIVALACPQTPEEAPPLKVVERRPAWFTLPVIRWGAVTAALGAILVVVIVHRSPIQPVHETMVVERKQSPVPAPASPALQAKTEASAPAVTATRTDKLQYRETAKSEVRPGHSDLNQPAEKQATAAGEAAGITAPSVNRSAKVAPARAESSPGYSVGGPIPAATVAAAAPGPAQSVTPAKPSNAEMDSAQAASVEVAKDKSDAAAESRKEAVVAGVQQAEAAPRPQALLKSGGSLLAPVAKKRAEAPSPRARWSISNTGKVERSLDSGTTWEELHLNDSLVFRVVTAAGSEVWAGGARGALYHSTDGGEHWTRVYLNPDRNGPADAILDINFTDPLHGRVTTGGDERWITSDGGLHWTRE